MTAVSDMGVRAHQDFQIRIDYTPGADVSAGDAINLGSGLIGVALTDMPSGKLNAVAIDGIIKVRNSGVSFAVGSAVGYSVAGKNAVAGGTGDFNLGVCVGSQGDAAGDEVYVRLNELAGS